MSAARRGARVGRRNTEAEIAVRLAARLRVGQLQIRGRDSRVLQRLVTVACREELEIRDPRGDLARAADRLTEAHGYAPQSSRLRQRWIVEVMRPTVEVPDGYAYLIEEWGARPGGRRVVFTNAASLDLAKGDLL